MRFVFRAIAAGILIGAALFFIPFLFGFLFFVLFLFIIAKLIGGSRRHHGHWGPRGFGRQRFSAMYDEYYGNGIVPIDGNRYNTSLHRGGAERNFPVE